MVNRNNGCISSSRANATLADIAASYNCTVQRKPGNGVESIRVLNSSKKIVASGTLKLKGNGYDSADFRATIKDLSQILNSSRGDGSESPDSALDSDVRNYEVTFYAQLSPDDVSEYLKSKGEDVLDTDNIDEEFWEQAAKAQVLNDTESDSSYCKVERIF